MTIRRVPSGYIHQVGGSGGGGGSDPEHEAQQDARLTSLEQTRTQSNTRLSNLETSRTQQAARITATEQKNTQQDGRISATENRAGAAETRLDNIEPVIIDYGDRISSLETDGGGSDARLTSLEASRTSQGNRITATEQKNTEQDGRLDALKGASDALTPRVTAVEQKATSNTGRLVTAEAAIAAQGTDIDALQNADIDHSQRLTTLETATSNNTEVIGGLSNRANALEQRATTIEGKNAEQDDRLTAVEALAEETATGSGFEKTENKGQPGGYASLDITGKLDESQIPNSLLGALNYKGVWNAETNTPQIQSSVGQKGEYYVVSVPFNRPINGNSIWNTGDHIVFNGTVWNKIEGKNSDVTSVNGVTPGLGGAINVPATAVPASDPQGLGSTTVQGQLNILAAGSKTGGTDINALQTAVADLQSRMTSNEQTDIGQSNTLGSHGTTLSQHAGLIAGKVDTASRGAANGIATLGPDARIPIEQMPDSVIGGSSYKGLWNAQTNSPALASSAGTEGDFYKVITAGNTNLDGEAEWLKGDTVAFAGGVWTRIAGGVPIQSINEQTGVKVTLYAGNIPTAPGGAPGTTVQAELNSLYALAGQVPAIGGRVGDLEDAIVLKLNSNARGAPNGVAPLDANAKVPVANLPSAVVGAMSYRGTWNAATNVPPLVSSTGVQGEYYVVSVEGTTDLDGLNDWNVGDWAVFNGTVWNIIRNDSEFITEVNDLKARATAVEGRATSLEGRANALEGRATAIEGVNTQQGNDILALQNAQSALESSVLDVQEKVTRVGATIEVGSLFLMNPGQQSQITFGTMVKLGDGSVLRFKGAPFDDKLDPSNYVLITPATPTDIDSGADVSSPQIFEFNFDRFGTSGFSSFDPISTYGIVDGDIMQIIEWNVLDDHGSGTGTGNSFVLPIPDASILLGSFFNQVFTATEGKLSLSLTNEGRVRLRANPAAHPFGYGLALNGNPLIQPFGHEGYTFAWVKPTLGEKSHAVYGTKGIAYTMESLMATPLDSYFAPDQVFRVQVYDGPGLTPIETRTATVGVEMTTFSDLIAFLDQGHGNIELASTTSLGGMSTFGLRLTRQGLASGLSWRWGKDDAFGFDSPMDEIGYPSPMQSQLGQSKTGASVEAKRVTFETFVAFPKAIPGPYTAQKMIETALRSDLVQDISIGRLTPPASAMSCQSTKPRLNTSLLVGDCGCADGDVWSYMGEDFTVTTTATVQDFADFVTDTNSTRLSEGVDPLMHFSQIYQIRQISMQWVSTGGFPVGSTLDSFFMLFHGPAGGGGGGETIFAPWSFADDVDLSSEDTTWDGAA